MEWRTDGKQAEGHRLCADGRTGRQAGRQADERTDGRMNGQAGTKTNGRTQTGGWGANRQTDIRIFSSSSIRGNYSATCDRRDTK